ncbi:alpha/beta hydrolase family protein [Pseudonocardia ailaonensis]|uniref:alpha/beta hydrolase family protein n=1 Tax=Pseudonocardia ailaonensis TaxID=367279 RepID=UPI0031D4F70B
MVEYFPGEYAWSSAVDVAVMAGGSPADIHRVLGPLGSRARVDRASWARAWSAMAHEQESRAEDDVLAGRTACAAERYLRASIYHSNGQRNEPPGPTKSEAYAAALQAFADAREVGALPLDVVHVDSPDGLLPGYLIRVPGAAEPPPVVVVFGGIDMTKELAFAIVRDMFAARGIACLVIDTPGTGELLRLRGVPSRPDSEVVMSAIVDHLETRSDVDASRVAVLGISMGGYHAVRAAAFEPRVGACVSWGAVWDYGEIWAERWRTRSDSLSLPWFQLPWVLGVEGVDQALERIRAWSLTDVWPRLRQPLLVLHGAEDRQIPVRDAYRAFAAAGSADKQLRVFAADEGGSHHIQSDDPRPARTAIGEWVARVLAPAAQLVGTTADGPPATD